MKIINIVHDANQNLLRNKLRTFLTILAIFIGSFAIILNTAINAGVNNFIDAQVDSYGGEGYLAIASQDSFEALSSLTESSGPTEYNPDKVQTSATPIDDETLEKLKNIDGIDSDSIQEAKTISIDYIASDKVDKKYLISAEALPPGNINIDTVAGTKPDNDNQDEYQITLESDYVEVLGYDNADDIIGKTVKLGLVDQYTQKTTELEAKVVGVIAPGVVSLGLSYTNVALSDKIYEENTKYYPEDMKDTVYSLTASYDYENYNIEDIKASLEEINLSAMTLQDMIGSIKSFFDVITTVFSIFGAIALLAAAIGIINTLFMSVQERTREIGLDKALGMSSKSVFLSFSCEAIMLGFWGSIVGIILSMLVGYGANAYLHTEGMILEAFPTFNLVCFTPQNIIAIVILIMAIAFIAGTAPARQAAKKNPIDALRYE